jgi:FtsP/CotA-like multicopper oxidase with cupredoxin domain
MRSNRRNFVAGGTALAAGLVLGAREASAQHEGHHGHAAKPAAPATVAGSREAEGGDRDPRSGRDFTPVTVPNGAKLAWKWVGGVKVFHLIAEPVQHVMVPGLELDCWGYNGRTPGPVIEVVQGDRVRIYVTNKLPEPTTVHWHGVLLPNGMDGVSGLNQKPIGVGETFKYEFTFREPGTFMYHPHFDEMTQMALGMMGMIVVHPRQRTGPRIDRDFVLITSEWFIPIGARRPDPLEMNDFNMLTFNSVAFPLTEPLVARRGDRVRIRLGNLGAMDHHPIHLHGYTFKVVATDGGAIPAAGQWPETTVLVPVGSTRDVEFVADAPGDWAMHCHMTHHVMNQMGHDTPSFVGADTTALDEKMAKLLPTYMTMGAAGMGGHGEHGMDVPKNSVPMRGAPGKHGYIDMGGMFTVLKVRDGLKDYEDPGWYEGPHAEQASAASADDLARDGIEAGVTPTKKSAGHGGHG